MQLIANRQLCGDYGVVPPDGLFECDDNIAIKLVTAGKARFAAAPRVVYETKVVTPEAPEVSAREPFRHLPVPDDGDPPAMVAVRDSVLAAANVSAQRTAGAGQRSRNARRSE